MILETLPNVSSLSREEKWQLAGELWDELLPESTPAIDDAIEKLIQARMETYRQNPESASSWAAVKERLKLSRNA